MIFPCVTEISVDLGHLSVGDDCMLDHFKCVTIITKSILIQKSPPWPRKALDNHVLDVKPLYFKSWVLPSSTDGLLILAMCGLGKEVGCTSLPNIQKISWPYTADALHIDCKLMQGVTVCAKVTVPTLKSGNFLHRLYSCKI